MNYRTSLGFDQTTSKYFVNQSGKPMTSQQFRQTVNRLIFEIIGIEGVNPHDIRRILCSLLIRATQVGRFSRTNLELVAMNNNHTYKSMHL